VEPLGGDFNDCLDLCPSIHSGCRSTKPGAVNVTQNPSVWDYLSGDFIVGGDTLYPDYQPMDIRAVGVGFQTSY